MASGRDVIRLLEDRSGFDGWWDSLGRDIREEIVADLDDLPGMEQSPPEEDDDA